jgi:UDP-N-acetylmuramoylalanine--D-glutamate ligase
MNHRLKEKKCVTILGLGETGLQSALFLNRRGYSVFVSDAQSSRAIEERCQVLRSEKISFEIDGHSQDKIGASDWVLISPGIPPTAPIYSFIVRRRIPLVSEVEVASWFSEGRLTAVTGTSGKTTVTTLLGRIFSANGYPSLVCGNIGNPWIGEIERIRPETEIVLEISSFQLLHTYSLKPSQGILLNIGPNHLDWHPDLNDYIEAKLRLFDHQDSEDFVLLRQADRRIHFPHYRFKGRPVFFDEGEGKNANEKLLNVFTRLKGLNPAKTEGVFSHFEGLEHRMEKVAEIGGIQFINDSKCTTLEALVWALDQFSEGKVILLAGGHAKGADFRSVRESLSRKLKKAFIYGEARSHLSECWEGTAPLLQVSCGRLSRSFKNCRTRGCRSTFARMCQLRSVCQL